MTDHRPTFSVGWLAGLVVGQIFYEGRVEYPGADALCMIVSKDMIFEFANPTVRRVKAWSVRLRAILMRLPLLC